MQNQAEGARSSIRQNGRIHEAAGWQGASGASTHHNRHHPPAGRPKRLGHPPNDGTHVFARLGRGNWQGEGRPAGGVGPAGEQLLRSVQALREDARELRAAEECEWHFMKIYFLNKF